MRHPAYLLRTYQAGFTLVELSIVIIIVGLLTAGGLAVGSSMVERAAYIDTQKLVAQIQQTLRDYYIVNGRLPCVARLTDTPGTDMFGEELDCVADSSTPGDTERLGVASEFVRVGMVPVRTLGLPDSAAQDKYGNRLIYAVTESLTSTGQFGSHDGAITVQDVGDTDILTKAVYFLASTGRDRKGGYGYRTGTRATDCGTTANRDVLNCTLDSPVFRDAPYNNGDVPGLFFDDITAWAPKFHFMSYDTETSALWVNENGTTNIYAIGTDGNWQTGNVGIGVKEPTQKLHVEGNLQVANGFLGIGEHGADYMHLSHPNYYTEFGDYAVLQHGTAGHLYLNSTNSEDDTFIGDILFRHKNADQMRLKGNTGFLGINIGAPQAHLHVNGGGRFTPTTKLQGTSYPTGENNGFAAVVQAPGVDSGGLLISVGDENNDEKAIDVFNESTNQPVFRVKSLGDIFGEHACRVVTGTTQEAGSTANCGADEWVMSGGGTCAGGTISAVHKSIPKTDLSGWIADCYSHNGTGDVNVTAYAICCKKGHAGY